ncbi:MAG: DUF507 family protein [Geobacteraceae bacterium]|nr:DUF507 family protein [Geobacteraceae bacterium]
MRLKEEQIQRLSEKVYNDLSAAGLITPRRERGAVVEGISKAISLDMSGEQALERDAERLLNETIAGLGRAAADIDRRKMLRMIKDRLAKERKIVL